MQLSRPAPHDTAHAPAEHTWPAAHGLPQAPQCPLSVCVSRHVPEQLVSPPPHDTAQAPIEHT
jgi:hypothetical protein